MSVIETPSEAVGLRLYKHIGDRLVACEAVRFTGGAPAIDTTLRRAALSGHVKIGGDIQDHFADILDDEQTILETVALDAKSYRALKTKWMRCKLESTP